MGHVIATISIEEGKEIPPMLRTLLLYDRALLFRQYEQQFGVKLSLTMVDPESPQKEVFEPEPTEVVAEESVEE